MSHREGCERARKRAKQCHALAIILTAVSLGLYVTAAKVWHGEILHSLVLFALACGAQVQALITAKAGERWAAIHE